MALQDSGRWASEGVGKQKCIFLPLGLNLAKKSDPKMVQYNPKLFSVLVNPEWNSPYKSHHRAEMDGEKEWFIWVGSVPQGLGFQKQDIIVRRKNCALCWCIWRQVGQINVTSHGRVWTPTAEYSGLFGKTFLFITYPGLHLSCWLTANPAWKSGKDTSGSYFFLIPMVDWNPSLGEGQHWRHHNIFVLKPRQRNYTFLV